MSEMNTKTTRESAAMPAATPTGEAIDADLDRVDELLSLLLDDTLSDAEAAELNELLASDPAARDRCCDATQLHADLTALFRGSEATPLLSLPLDPAPMPATGGDVPVA